MDRFNSFMIGIAIGVCVTTAMFNQFGYPLDKSNFSCTRYNYISDACVQYSKKEK